MEEGSLVPSPMYERLWLSAHFTINTSSKVIHNTTIFILSNFFNLKRHWMLCRPMQPEKRTRSARERDRMALDGAANGHICSSIESLFPNYIIHFSQLTFCSGEWRPAEARDHRQLCLKAKSLSFSTSLNLIYWKDSTLYKQSLKFKVNVKFWKYFYWRFKWCTIVLYVNYINIKYTANFKKDKKSILMNRISMHRINTYLVHHHLKSLQRVYRALILIINGQNRTLIPPTKFLRRKGFLNGRVFLKKNEKFIMNFWLGLKRRQAEKTSAQIRRRCHNNVNKNMWGLRPTSPPQVNKPSYRGPAAPGPPAIYPSHLQKHFHRHSNGVLFALTSFQPDVFSTSPWIFI